MDLTELTQDNILPLASSLLFSLKGNPKYSVLSELSYLLDYESFIKLLKYYGGQTITIPTVKELEDMLRVMLLYQYNKIEHRPFKESFTLAGYTEKDDVNFVKSKLNLLDKAIKK